MAVTTGISAGSMWKYYEGTHAEVIAALDVDGINDVNRIKLSTNGTGSIVVFANVKSI